MPESPVTAPPTVYRFVSQLTATLVTLSSPSAKTITVAGDPVTLNDDQRGVARGRQLVYDVASGTVRLSAEEKAAPEGPA